MQTILTNKTQSTEVLLEMVQTDSNLFKGRFSTLEKDIANLAHKTQSMTVGAETLFERIHTVECINQTLSKGYDRLTDKMSLQEGNMYAKKIVSKDETLSLLDITPWILSESIRREHWTGNPDIKKAMVNRFEKN